jgi:hypothetical protein
MLEGIARSLRAAGFRTICLLADNGASQAPQEALAARLTAEWRAEGVRVIAVGSYYRAIAAQDAWLATQGETPATIGDHAGIGDTSELMAVHPRGVDLSRLPADRSRLPALGASGDPSRASAARGEALLAMRIAEIRAAREPRSRRSPGCRAALRARSRSARVPQSSSATSSIRSVGQANGAALEEGAAMHRVGIERLGVDPAEFVVEGRVADEQVARAPGEHRLAAEGARQRRMGREGRPRVAQVEGPSTGSTRKGPLGTPQLHSASATAKGRR